MCLLPRSRAEANFFRLSGNRVLKTAFVLWDGPLDPPTPLGSPSLRALVPTTPGLATFALASLWHPPSPRNSAYQGSCGCDGGRLSPAPRVAPDCSLTRDSVSSSLLLEPLLHQHRQRLRSEDRQEPWAVDRDLDRCTGHRAILLKRDRCRYRQRGEDRCVPMPYLQSPVAISNIWYY
jgi:hypothetical protein